MKALIQLALCGALMAGGAMAQRGGGGGGHMGGGGMGGGGFHGGGGMGGGGFHGGGGMGGGGFHGGGSFGGGGFRGGGFNGGFRGGGFNSFRGNTVVVNRGFGGGCWGCGSWGWPAWGGGWGWSVGAGWGWPDSSYYSDYSTPVYQTQTQPNVTVVYPQQSQPAYVERATPAIHEYDQYGQPTGQYGQPAGGSASGSSGSPIYLIATKDGSIHAALSYSVNGSSLSYTTIDHQQKMVSLDQVDRSLSERLNNERRVTFSLPSR